MNYSKIEETIRSRNLVMKYFLERVGITPNGFRLAMKNNTLKVKDLEEISKQLGVSVTSWWDAEQRDLEKDPKAEKSLRKENELLRRDIKTYIETIENLNKRIRELEENVDQGTVRKRAAS